jgi:hypothetical protein
MLIKSADDQSKRLALLESLEQSSLLDGRQKEWLSEQLWALRMGRSGENDAAHYLDRCYRDNTNLALIHDLRLEWEGEVAQIDHLLISRGFMFYLLETKNFSGNLSINEHGEFEVSSRFGPRGIPSPIAQSKCHEGGLAKWLEHLGITGRLGSRPQFFHVVLLNPKRTIRRPDPSKFNTSNVIKADAFEEWRSKHVDNGISFGQTLTAMANLRSGDTVREWAQKLVRQHRPADPLWLPDFMQPRGKAEAMQELPAAPTGRRAVCASCAKPLTVSEQAFCANNAATFDGGMLCMAHQQEYRQAKAQGQTTAQLGAKPAATPSQALDPRKRKLICCACDARISYEEGKFCWNNERRFGGLQYCRTHQAEYR